MCLWVYTHTPGPGVFKKETLVAVQVLCFVKTAQLVMETMLLKYRQLET